MILNWFIRDWLVTDAYRTFKAYYHFLKMMLRETTKGLKGTITLSDSHKAGGAAMAGGQHFQAQVTAWWCAHILLQTPLGSGFDLSVNSIPERVYCETTDSIDDLRVEFSGKEQVFGQCKKRLNLSSDIKSDWASVLKQFYGELQHNSSSEIIRRFVLFYEKPNENLRTLNMILRRYRQLPIGALLVDAAKNEQERHFISNLIALLECVEANLSQLNISSKRETLLHNSYIQQLQLSVDQADFLSVANALRHNLLVNTEQVNVALNSLQCLADELLAKRGSASRATLRELLLSQDVMLKDSVNYRLDFGRLDDLSFREISGHIDEGRSRLVIAKNQLCISRSVVQEMFKAVQKISFLVIGSAGIGKTGCLLTLAKQLGLSGFRVWYWAADSLPYPSHEEIGTYLQLQHSWSELFVEAASGSKTVLIIDGLDGLRDSKVQNAYRKLIVLAIQSNIRVVASIRSFDLRYATDLQETFPVSSEAVIPAHFQSAEFRKISHIIVPELDDPEFNQVIAHLPVVKTILDQAPQLLSIVHNLFNLDLLCKLISDGDSVTQLSSLSTQAELFERHWQKRIESHLFREELKETLKALIQKMVHQQTLQVVPDKIPTQVNAVLFSSDFIRHPISPSGRLPDQETVEFTHHLLFDYVAELLFVRPRRKKLATELATPDTWALFLRPSLALYYRYAWTHGRQDFWDTILNLEKSSVPLIHILPGYLVVADEALVLTDLQPLLDNSLRRDSDSIHWIRITSRVITAAAFSSLPRLFSIASGDWWIEFARELVSTDRSELVFAGRKLLFSASDTVEKLSGQSKLTLNQSSIVLIKFHWANDTQPNPAIRIPIKWLCRTISFNRLASSEFIQKILDPMELQRAGYIQAFEIASNIEYIWQADPSLAVKVYDSIFGFLESNVSVTPMGSGQILSLTSNRKQDYEMAYYQLFEKFAAFLSACPKEATQALIKVIRHYLQQHHLQSNSHAIETFNWAGQTCRIQPDYSYMLDNYTDSTTISSRCWILGRIGL